MRNLQWELVEKTVVKNSIGEAETIFNPVGFLYTSPLIPLNISEPVKDYGFDPLKTFQVRTRDSVSDNQYVRLKDNVYFIKIVQQYERRHSVCYLELIE